MRQHVIIALLAVCATLLAVDFVTTLNRSAPNVAFGQTSGSSAGGSYVMVSGVTTSGSEAVLYLLDTASNKVACYTTKGQGIEFKGVRSLAHDFKADWIVGRGPMPPDEVKTAIDKAKK